MHVGKSMNIRVKLALYLIASLSLTGIETESVLDLIVTYRNIAPLQAKTAPNSKTAPAHCILCIYAQEVRPNAALTTTHLPEQAVQPPRTMLLMWPRPVLR